MPGGAQPIEASKHYNLEFGGCRYRYDTALMRVVSVGSPSKKLARVKPGVTCGEVATTYCKAVEKGGYIKDSRCGYPMGINWLETSCSLRTDDPTVMQPNMVFNLMLGMWLEEDFGAVISETFVVTPNGHEVFSRYPRELIVV
jgi:ectoine hydrolase